ncbi:hypothetical protein [Acinetobacter phage Ab69]|nr:hypothetical protein [Acinetobacter phage Ab69]
MIILIPKNNPSHNLFHQKTSNTNIFHLLLAQKASAAQVQLLQFVV